MHKNALALLCIAVLTLGLSACGSSTETKTVVQQKETQGQQLLDLKEAHDKGVITDSEYNRTKNEILKNG